MDGLKVCGNLYWLKASGKFTLHGLSIVYLSARQSGNGSQFGTCSQDDVDALRALAEEPGIVDIFLTAVTNRASTSDIPPGISDSAGANSTISELVAEIKPRSISSLLQSALLSLFANEESFSLDKDEVFSARVMETVIKSL